jgi:hypothetical protein
MADEARLARECSVFCRYLSGEEPSDYVRAKYRAAHEAGAVEPADGATSFDRALVAIARGGPWLTRAMDSYARVFANAGLLRRKLVLVLALLETKSPSDRAVDSPTSSSKLAFFASIAWLGLAFALTVAVTAIALLPVRLVCLARPR